MSPIIEVRNLIKKYKSSKKNAVDDVSLSVGEGEFFAFLGPNGAGKTTTISILTTTLSKTSGTVRIAGYDLDKNESNIRQHIGIIFQNPSLDRNLSAEENIRLHAILYGMYPYRPTFALMPDSYKKKVKELADLLGLGDDIRKPMHTFSGGMKRKLEIIRGLMHNPRVLFLDEPTIGLDPASRRTLWEYLREVRKQTKTTIFLTTHYLDEAEGADHVAIINNGKIITYGTPSSIKDKLVENYLLVDTNDRDELLKELKTKKISHSVDQSVRINLGKKRAQEVIQQIHTKLTSIVVHTPTLEDAYLEVIGETKHE